MERALLDTDIFSEVLKGRDALVQTRAKSYRRSHGRYTISSVTITEVIKGLQRLGREAKIQQVISAVSSEEVLSLDAEEAVIAGRIYGDLERSGQPIGRADPLIAATAIVHDLELVTGNTDHFLRIRLLGYQLRLSNWRLA